MIIDGRAIAAKTIAELKALNKDWTGKKAVGILVGEAPDSLSFLWRKKRTAVALGIDFRIKKIKSPIAVDALYRKVKRIVEEPGVAGAIVQLKIPDYSNEDTQKILNAIPLEKDIDCLSQTWSDRFYGDPLHSKILPPAAGAVKTIIKTVCHCESDEAISEFIRGKKAVVYGFGRLVGQPSEAWLRAAGADITIIRSASTDVERAEALAGADIVVTGVGKPEKVHITGAMIKSSAIVIDFGYPADCDAASIDVAGGLVTPTPGGTGPILVAELFRNLFKLNP